MITYNQSLYKDYKDKEYIKSILIGKNGIIFPLKIEKNM